MYHSTYQHNTQHSQSWFSQINEKVVFIVTKKSVYATKTKTHSEYLWIKQQKRRWWFGRELVVWKVSSTYSSSYLFFFATMMSSEEKVIL